MQLVIGNKNYSSWSMRPWVLMQHFDVSFDEIRVPLFSGDYQQALAKFSSALRVPVLVDRELKVWDSLAICEYVNEAHLDGMAFPAAAAERAICRAYCSEMHSSFTAIREQLPMNCRARKRIAFGEDLEKEIYRIDLLWVEARQKFYERGDYLFGSFSMADAFFAPIVSRFKTYGVEVSEESQLYMETMLKNQAVGSWLAAAAAEVESLPAYEIGEDIGAA